MGICQILLQHRFDIYNILNERNQPIYRGLICPRTLIGPTGSL